MLKQIKKRREEVDLRNEADHLVFTTEKTLKDLEGKVDEAEVAKANEAKDKVKTALEGTDVEAIKVAKDELQEVVQALSTKLYEEAAKAAQAAQGAQGEAQGEAKADDNVVDAEYEEVKEDERK